jgi:predicted RNA-binding protein with RPS1 domain
MTKIDLKKNTKYAALYHSEHWGTIQEIADSVIKSIQDERITGETVDAIVIGTLDKQGKIDGINKLLKTIETYANKSTR